MIVPAARLAIGHSSLAHDMSANVKLNKRASAANAVSHKGVIGVDTDMSRYLSADEVKNEQITAMGPALGEEFHALYEELFWLCEKWREYQGLFGTSEKRIDLLNEAAPAFFVYLQNTLWEDALLHLSRLTGPPRTMGRDNLTIRRLPDLITDAGLQQHVAALVDTAVAKSAFAHDWRNRHIAHRDLPLALARATPGLAFASRLQVQDSITAVGDVLNAIHTHYLHFEVLFELPGAQGDVLDLLNLLKDGVRARKAREQRFELGQPSQEDLDLGESI